MREVHGWTLRVVRRRAAKATAARPLLFFTGLGAATELLAPFLERLEGRDVVTFDMPGIGLSQEPDRPYRPKSMARVADRLLTDLGYCEVDVMGVSWGGLIAQQYAFSHRRRVGRLILAATGAGAVMVPGHLSAIVPMMSARRHHEPGFMWRHFETIYGGDRPPREAFPRRLAGPSRRGYAYQLLAMAGWTSLPMLPFIKAPTLILAGDDDRLLRPVNAHLLRLFLPRSELRMIEGAGHMFLLTHTGEIAGEVGRFLDARDAASARQVPMPALT